MRFHLVVIALSLCMAVSPFAADTAPKAPGRECRYPDVENIGNREINGRIYLIFPNFISYEKEIQIGAQYAAQIEQSTRLLTDQSVVDYVKDLTQNLVRHSDAKVPFVIRVVDSDEVNAFALPGGHLFVNKGLIETAETEDELVGVICHEIAHVAARHASERLTKAQLLNWAAIPTIFVGGAGGIALRNGIGLALDLQILGISRGSEREADILGAQYAWHAGFDPDGFLTFFEKMLTKEKKQPGKLASWFRTHPTTPDRITYMKEEVEKCLPERPKYLVTSSRFDDMKAKLLAYDNTLQAANKGPAGKSDRAPSKPTLKRRTDTDPSDTDPQDRPAKPTLKKGDDK